MGKYINNTSRLCVAPMPEADVFAKEHFAEGFPCAKDTADAFKRLQDDLYAQGLITILQPSNISHNTWTKMNYCIIVGPLLLPISP